MIFEWRWRVPEGDGDQRKKGAPCHPPGTNSMPNRQSPNAELFEIQDQNAPWQRNPRPHKWGGRLISDPPFVRFIDLLA
ncbi:hypothetical protein PDIG_80570 [Penicillium digitatum PHI26]|uniref:Uncharacterized protein n=2 Tax=Penicillium digitatum TaxID=36651 RepID=K9F8Y3_PEND2|nr:hypothetical protein PDIP_28960 [Penicillium digitatum Pd1]EKV05860.1 hypothetical protein PDIG_80570 [Penicillium digitatum PHI26]EKV17918.1 hypothetical protein PDIP_28960 [Penicillium digitatum Pd1]